jgi:hypothetical protein
MANISKFEPAHNLLQELKTNTASLIALTGAQKNVSSHLIRLELSCLTKRYFFRLRTYERNSGLTSATRG